MIDLATSQCEGAKIRVVGVGGGGGNAVNNMIVKGLTGVDFIVANTDKQALDHNLAPFKIQIGKETTRGLGAGANPEIGKKSVEENYDEIRENLKGSDMLFVTAGMGGGTGTGGAPIIAKIGQELGSLVVGIITKPFNWEQKKRLAVAESGINELRQYVDALIVIPNQQVLKVIDKKSSFKEAFKIVDEVLYNATRGISEIISCHGDINVDFADVKTIMKGMGDALMGIGSSSGENRAVEAMEKALNSPLLDGISVHGAQGILLNFYGWEIGMHEIDAAVSMLESYTGGEANLIYGIVSSPEPTDEFRVTVVATGFKKPDIDAKKIEKPKLIEKEIQNQNGHQSDRHVFQKPSIVFQRKEALPTETIIKPLLTELREKPRGPEELKKMDQPAVIRREGTTILQYEINDMDKEEKQSIASTSNIETTISANTALKNTINGGLSNNATIFHNEDLLAVPHSSSFLKTIMI